VGADWNSVRATIGPYQRSLDKNALRAADAVSHNHSSHGASGKSAVKCATETTQDLATLRQQLIAKEEELRVLQGQVDKANNGRVGAARSDSQIQEVSKLKQDKDALLLKMQALLKREGGVKQELKANKTAIQEHYKQDRLGLASVEKAIREARADAEQLVADASFLTM